MNMTCKSDTDNISWYKEGVPLGFEAGFADARLHIRMHVASCIVLRGQEGECRSAPTYVCGVCCFVTGTGLGQCESLKTQRNSRC